jgi:YcxB-like protein
MDERKIEIEVLIEFKEYLKLTYFNIFSKLWFIWIVFLLMAFYTIYESVNSTVNITAYYFVISIAPYIFLFIFLIIYPYFSAKRNLKISPVLKRVTKYQFSEEKITVMSEIFDSNLSWENIIKAQEKVNIITLYTTQNAGYFLPLRCFANDSQLIEFRELVRRNLGDKAKLKS